MSKVKLFIFSVILAYCVFALICSASLKRIGDPNKVPENLRKFAQFRYHFFTIWNYILQLTFLVLAIIDEGTKLLNVSKIQKPIGKARRFLFSTLVFPSSLLVMTIFWGIWHIDRELIFPKAIDDFFPTWLNHSLHTLIVIPLIIEVLCQTGNDSYKISRVQAIFVVLLYGAIYKILYLSVYFQHGIWLYPVYKILNWPQRFVFVSFQLALMVSYQQVGISLLNRKSKTTEQRKKLY